MGPGDNGNLDVRERNIDIHIVSSSESSEKDDVNVEEVSVDIDKGVCRAIMYWCSRKETWRQEWMSKFEVDCGAGKKQKRAGKRAKRKFYGSERARDATL